MRPGEHDPRNSDRSRLARSNFDRLLARAGVAASAFAVFTCGWLAMRTDDWRYMLLFTALAGISGVIASAFSKRAK